MGTPMATGIAVVVIAGRGAIGIGCIGIGVAPVALFGGLAVLRGSGDGSSSSDMYEVAVSPFDR